MVDITFDETALLLQRRVVFGIACPRFRSVVVIVAPFREMVCEFEARCVGGCVFEVYDDELFVGVLGKEKWGGCGAGGGWFRDEAENVAVLCLDGLLDDMKKSRKGNVRRCEQIQASASHLRDCCNIRPAISGICQWQT